MKKTEASYLARKLMNEHGLGHVTFEWSNRKHALGDCSYKRNASFQVVPDKIRLSAVWVPYLDEAEVRDTILHEIAHALTPGHKHDYVWKAMCRKVGANPKRTAEAIPMELRKRVGRNEFKYEARCVRNSEHVMYFNRYGKVWQRGGYVCAECGGSFRVTRLH